MADHLWQSTLCGAALWLMTLTLRRNRAAVRYWLWLTASVKLLIPFPFWFEPAVNSDRDRLPRLHTRSSLR